MNNFSLERIVNRKLKIDSIEDYTPNGLQVEGRKNVSTVLTGVSVCQPLIESAVERKADAIIVHHGILWNREPLSVQGVKRTRLQMLLQHDLNLYAWHLPLDVHPTLGNNAQLSRLLDIQTVGRLNRFVWWGKLPVPLRGKTLRTTLERRLHNRVFHVGNDVQRVVKTVAWCSGSGQNFVGLTRGRNIDAFISGEISESTVHAARELDLHFYAAGHHATERGGIRALGEWLSRSYRLEVKYVDVFNPV